MALEEPLVLPADVEIVSVQRLSAAVREGLDCEPDDWAVTRRRARGGSHIVDGDTAAILQLFRAPTRAADAIVAYAAVRRTDPDATLDELYPVLLRLWRERILVAPESEAEVATLARGARVGAFEVVRCVRSLDDTELHLGRDARGEPVAIKLGERDAIAREAALLGRVGDRRAPELLGLVETSGRSAVVMRWINGTDVLSRARELRRRTGRAGLLALCAEVADAIADLHDLGVVHGDVNPQNLLAEPSGRVRVIDFGLSRDLTGPARAVGRGGVPFYFEPEYARAQLDDGVVPATPAGEQYAVAALLYAMWTGAHHLDWRLERGAMLRQIAEDPPVPFAARTVAPFPELEALLGTALAKDPAARHGSVRALADGLRDLAPVAAARDARAPARRRPSAATDLAQELLDRYAVADGERLVRAEGGAPVVSLTYGAAGIAYAIYRIALLRADPEAIALADRWTQHAAALADHPRAFYSDALDITPAVVGTTSTYHSPVGLHLVRTLVSASVGDRDTATAGLDALLAGSRLPCDNPDLTLGDAGVLLALCEVLEALPAAWQPGLAHARSRGDELAAQLERILRAEDLATSPRLSALGIAHGWAGLLFALLRWAAATGTAPPAIVRERLDELLGWAEPHAGGLRWPVYNTAGALHHVEGWCNGTAGHAMLFGLADRVLGGGPYADAAVRAAESASATETELGTLCCGLAGIGYAQLCAFRLTGDDAWRRRAERTARLAPDQAGGMAFRHALYKGAVGVAVLAQDIREPEHAAMPAFESLRLAEDA